MMRKLLTLFAMTIMIVSLSQTTNILPPAVEPAGAAFIQTDVMTTYDGTNTFSLPVGLASNSTHIGISDTGLDKIFFYNHQMQLQGTLDGTIGGPGSFTTNLKIFMDDQYTYVPDGTLNVVKIFDLAGNYQFSLGNGTAGATNEELNAPEAVLANGTHIFVSDNSNNRIQVFTITGNYVATYGSGILDSPEGLAYNGSHLFVADYNNHVIRIFNPDGSLSTSYVGLSGPRSSTSTVSGRLNLPVDVSIDPVHGYVYAISNLQVYVYLPNGQNYDYIGEFANQDESTAYPFDIPYSVLSNGTHVFVSEIINTNQINIFRIGANLGTTTISETQTETQTETSTETQVSTETQTETETETETETNNQTQTETQHQTVTEVSTVIQERNNTISVTPSNLDTAELALPTIFIIIGLILVPVIRKKMNI